MTNAAQHLEQYLGQIARGWGGYGGALTEMQVCLFENSPIDGAVTYATLGLSNHVLNMPRARAVRQEFLLSVATRFADDSLAKLLAYVAEQTLSSHRALLRGQVLSLGNAVARGSRCDSLYVSLPVVFPEGISTLGTTSPPTVVVWLVPVLPAESVFVAENGWNEFEDQLEAAAPDLFDLARPSIV